jgi:hypothetical protein
MSISLFPFSFPGKRLQMYILFFYPPNFFLLFLKFFFEELYSLCSSATYALRPFLCYSFFLGPANVEVFIYSANNKAQIF